MFNNTQINQAPARSFLFASDFDKTLSFDDSGQELANLLGLTDFEARCRALAEQNLVQQGGELAYLLLHDAAFAAVRKEHLVEAGRRVAIKHHIKELYELLNAGFGNHAFAFYVISAAPQEIVESALGGIVPKERIIGTQCRFDSKTGRIVGIERVPAGFGKVAVLQRLQHALGIPCERTVFVGDGPSDVHVMLHVGERNGYTIAVSNTEQVTRIARRTVLSADATAVLVPVLEDICHLGADHIRALFESHGLTLWAWSKMRTDVLTVGTPTALPLGGAT